MDRASVVIVTPALAAANNGNWQTASRWARMLSDHYRVRVTDVWAQGDEDLMIALHARRSAASVQAWVQRAEKRPLAVVLTGTDLYRDILNDAAAQRSLVLADRLIVLNELGLQSLPPALRGKGRVCLQSAPARMTVLKTQRHLRAVMVGHLRDEKSPQTYFAAAQLLANRQDLHLDHIGADLDAELGAQARALTAALPRYRWLGALPHGQTRKRIQAAHVLVHCSRMEGGAHVVIEALTSGTPVLASRIDGNLGLLGADYAGLFDWGDAHALAAGLQRCRDDQAFLAHLQQQCQQRAALFLPAKEKQCLLKLTHDLLGRPLNPPTPRGAYEPPR